MGRLLALLAALIAGGLLAWASQLTPAPAPASADAAGFSAARAMTDVRAIAVTPHPMGSAANLQVRDHLVARMTTLGLAPRVSREAAFTSREGRNGLRIDGGYVENIVGVLPGRDRAAPAAALMSHYDSVPSSPGAADDAAGVASALEIVRAIKARGVPARDVMVVITDGEEAGLLGAEAFFRKDPAARHIGFALNMETRGGGGRVQMFETSDRNGEVIALLRRAAERPSSSSLSVFLYRHMPNDTDFSLAKAAGVQGMNFAFIGRQFDYHSPTATPANLDAGALQDMGGQVLSAAAALAFAPQLPARAPDAIHSQVAGDVLLAYGPTTGWLILAAAAGLLTVGWVRARRAEKFPLSDVVRGAGGLLFVALSAAAILHFARRAVGVDVGYLEQRFLLAEPRLWEAAVMLLAIGLLLAAAAELARGRRKIALLPLAAGLAGSLFGGFDLVGLVIGAGAALVGAAACGRRVSRPPAWAGVLILGLILGVAAMVFAPAISFAIAWPLALACLGAALTSLACGRGPVSLTILGLLAALGLGWIGGMAHMAHLGLDLPEVLTVPLVMATLLIWPLAHPTEGAPPERLIGPLTITAGLVVLAIARWHHPYDARHPQASQVAYELDQDAGKAWRVSSTPDLPDWSREVLTTEGATPARRRSWALGRLDAAPAPYLAQPAPEITLTALGNGRLRLHVQPPPGARTLDLRLQPNTAVFLEEIAGVPARAGLSPVRWTRLRWEAAQPGLDLVIRAAGPGRLQVDYAATLEAWPTAAAPLPARPADVMPFGQSDSTVVTGGRRLSW